MQPAGSPIEATLQIRDLADPLHHQLQLRARRHHRSLSQQALADLQALADEQGKRPLDPSLEELIRQDRSR
jgi:plasmid stability protein